LLDKRLVQIFDPEDRLGLEGDTRFSPIGRRGDWKLGNPGVWVSWKEDCLDSEALKLYPKSLYLGMGGRRGIPADEILAHVYSVFSARGLALKSIVSLGSIEAKSDEVGLLEAAQRLGVTPVFYSSEALGVVEVPTPSERVKKRMGVPSVAEAAALLLSKSGELIVPKQKTKTVTLAVARR
jgi:cobalt-precorrin 5A hydrolase